jgi:hypothetical protein
MNNMPRSSFLKLLFAFSAGCLLLWLAVVVAGVLAAYPAPDFLQPPLQGQSLAELTLQSTLLVHIPIALLSGLFAWVFFCLLGARGPMVVIALAAPWLIYCLYAALSWYQGTQFSPLYILTHEMAWHKWVGRLSVPLGVWVASRLFTGNVRSAG